MIRREGFKALTEVADRQDERHDNQRHGDDPASPYDVPMSLCLAD